MLKNPVLFACVAVTCGMVIGVGIAFRTQSKNHGPIPTFSTASVPTTITTPLTPSSTTLEPVEQAEHTVDVSAVSAPPTATSTPVFPPPTSSVEQAHPSSSTKPVQYVVLAFDGSRSIDMWKETRAFAKDMEAQGAPVRFTYFINAVYLLAWQHRDVYHPPQHATGTSPIGFATSEKDVADRIEQINAAIDDGHEIGCHLTGHFNGSTWSEAEWRQEFQSFFDITERVSTINHLEKEPLHRRVLNIPSNRYVGFRAPELGVNANLWPILREFGFHYDTSLTDKLGAWPSRRAQGLWEFPLTRIYFGDSPTSTLLSMDYNFYFKQSKAIDTATRGTPLWDEYYTQMMQSYHRYFERSYTGNRAPIFIGHHFSQWNDGVYWEAMKTFAREVCGKPDVKCVSYKDVMEDLNRQAIQ